MKNNKSVKPVYLIFSGLTLLFPLIFLFFSRTYPGLPEVSVYFLLGISIALPQLGLYVFLARSRKNETRQIDDLNKTPERREAGGVSLEFDKIESPDDETISEGKLDAVALRAILIRPILDELCNSISLSLSSTTEPISDELLRIKSTAASFLNGMKEYEGEINGHATLLRIESESKGFKSDMDHLSELVRDAFFTLESQFTQLRTVSDRIAEVAKSIANVSANIHVLSINASIEAARTGEAGKGFRVIASEVKVLSGQTEKHLAEINATMEQTRDIFGKIGACLSESKARVVNIVDTKKNNFNDFASILDDYFKKFESLYSGVEKVIGSLSKGMDVISPVIQLHEITSQEIGNLRLVADDFTASLSQVGKTEAEEGHMRAQAKEIAADVRKRVTTERELLALKRGLGVKVNNLDFDFAINNSDIELF